MKRTQNVESIGILHPAPTGHEGTRGDPADGPVMVIDTYLPRPGLRGTFLAKLAEQIHRTGSGGPGSGGRVYRSLDGEAVVVVTEFNSRAEKARWHGSQAHCTRLEHLRPLLEHALSRTCEPVAANNAPDTTRPQPRIQPDRSTAPARRKG